MNRKILFIVHLIFWIIFLFNNAIQENFKVSIFQNPFNWSGFLVNFIIFYIHYFLVVPFLMKKSSLSFFILGFLLSFFFFIFFRYLVEEIFFLKIFGMRNYVDGTTVLYYIFDNFYWGSNAIFISSLIWFLDYSVRIDKENRTLLQQKNEAEMSLLKSQINPHFIFNTLNNIYSLVNQKSDKSLNAIEKLGDLLRFSTTEIRKDFTSLHSEIQYLKNYIDLESLRISTPENILFEAKTENKDLKIAPMILIPFVENAFKHGNLRNFPLEISIETKANQLLFHQKNKISNLEKDKSSGIGIENVKKRLSIIYPDKHQLEILNDGEFYEVNLMVNL